MAELDVDSIFKFKVDELKQELAKRGLPKSGSKSDLQERLLQYVTSKLYTNESSVEEDSSIAVDVDVDGKLEASLDEEFDVSDHAEERLSKQEDGISPVSTNVLSDEFINIDELPNDSVVSNENIDEYKIVDQTKDTSADDDVVTDEQPKSESKFCRVTITSPEITERQKKQNRSKRFGDALSSEEGEADKKKARLGRFSSMGMGKGETVTEEDIEKIKKRAERFGAVSSILTSPVNASEDRLQSRKERFADANVKKRLERFGTTNTKPIDITPDMEVKKQNRLAKFGAL